MHNCYDTGAAMHTVPYYALPQLAVRPAFP